jgi:hypothetical protein
MAIPTDVEQIGYNGPNGTVVRGQRKPIIQSVGATRTLLAKESGSTCLLDRAAGVVYTLPTCEEGLEFEFVATVAVTSNAYKVITASAAEFLIGGVMIGSLTVAESGDVFQADGSTIVAISEDGATKGGLIGGHYRVRAISSTQWLITGTTVGAGTLATPFATS